MQGRSGGSGPDSVGGHGSRRSIDTARQTAVIILSARSAQITPAGVMLTRAIRSPG